MAITKQPHIKSRSGQARPWVAQGFSLIEVLMIITLMSTIIIPFTIMMTQTSKTAKGSYVHSSRNMIMSSVSAQLDPARANFDALFNDGAKVTTFSESGRVIPYRRVVNAGSSDTLKRTVHLYLYNNSSDADNSPRSRVTVTKIIDGFRLNVGDSGYEADSQGYQWQADAYAYSNTSTVKRPGYVGAAPTACSTTTNPSNIISSSDATVFKSCRDSSTNLDYSFPLTNGYYTVKLYFNEIVGTVSGVAGNRRRMDIYIEDLTTAKTTAYSPYEVTGGTDKAHILTYDADVQDGVLNIRVSKNSGSNHNARLFGISIQKRRLQ